MTVPSPLVGSPRQTMMSTSLVLVGTIVEVLRERFTSTVASDPAISDWAWSSDPKTTKIFVDSGFNLNIEARNVRPGVWVDRLQNVYGPVSIGYFDQNPEDRRVQLEQFYCMGETDIIVDCTSPNRGESMLLGSIVQDFLQMTSKPIMEIFFIRNLSPMSMGRTEPYEKDKTLWNTPIQFRANYEVRWAIMPAAPLLNKIVARLQDIDYPSLYWRQILPP